MAETTSLPSLPPTPAFAEFYQAINGRDPFPWQARLAAQVADTEKWPCEIGVPTGLGKTACLDIALWWLASQADRAPAKRTAPTRIWWLVNRRLPVDSTTDHATSIGRALTDPGGSRRGGAPAEAVAAIADRLRSLSAAPDAAPLEVIRLRGWVPARRPTDSSQPAILLSTLPMYGSRLLFRGYGSTRSMRPIDAALAGTDSLVMVDETPAAGRLIALLPALAACTPAAESILGCARSRPAVVSLTATGAASARERFGLDDDDEAHSIVRQRLDAQKPTTLHVASGSAGRLLAEAARSLIEQAPGPASCLVFANTPATARDAFLRLRGMAGKAEVLLLTGLARERTAERAWRRILDPVHGMPACHNSAQARQRHLIVVATETLQGADIDAEFLVTEACGVRALTQRLGRLNRLGRYPHARAAYVHLPPPRDRRGPWPVYGREPDAVLQRLKAAPRRAEDGAVNLTARCAARILGPPNDAPERATEVTQDLLWEWVKTTIPPDGEAPVAPFFSGIATSEHTVSIAWRVHVPEDGELLWPRLADRETVDVPLNDARAQFVVGERLRRLGSDGVTVETVSHAELRPGNTVVLTSNRGLMDEYGWTPQSSVPVVDLSIAEHGLPLDAIAIRRLYGRRNWAGRSIHDLVKRALGPVADGEDLDEADRDAAVRQLLETIDAVTPPGWEEAEWHALVAALDQTVVTARNEIAHLARPDAREPLSDELDELSRADPCARTASELDRHGMAVAARARAIAERLGISRELTAIVERAGRSHDLGKADPRFQRWLDPDGEQGTPAAKSSRVPRSEWTKARIVAGWPEGGRHEALSARLVRRWLALDPEPIDPSLADLLVHLVVSHHGSGRPLVPPAADYAPDPVCAQIAGAAVDAAADLSTIDWSQPARFSRLNDRFGPWGLALLEAIVRQADHTVSTGSCELELR